MKKGIAVLAAIMPAILAFPGPAFAGKGLIRVGYAQIGHESDWRIANTRDYEAVFSEEAGYDLFLIDCDNDHAAQLEAVRSFIAQGLDYIVIAPIQSAGWDTVLQEAQSADIPVIIADREMEADACLYDAWVGTDPFGEGVTAGRWLAQYLDGAAANILQIEGSVGSYTAISRTDGLQTAIDEHDNWTLLDSQSGGLSKAGGQEVMESFLKSYEGQFNVVICQSDNEAFGAMAAMDEAGVTYGVGGDVILISYDAGHDGLKATLEGKLHCDVECNPLQASAVAEVIAKMEAGEEYPIRVLIEDQAFTAPGIRSEHAVTMTQEILDGRAY